MFNGVIDNISGNKMASKRESNILAVAAAAGTSAMTVTRAFSESGRIAPETRSRILKVAKELGYQPNFFARGMRGSRSMSVGMLMSMGVQRPINGKIRAITSKLYEAGYIAYVADSFSDTKVVAKLLEAFLLRKIDALFFQTAFRHLLEDKRVKELLAELPAVLVESFWRLDTPHDQLVLDQDGAFRAMARHFLNCGRKRLVVIAAEGEGTTESIETFREAMDLPTGNVLAAIDTTTAHRGALYVDALRRSFPDLRGIDAIWCATDDGAAAVARHLAAAGVRVPEDVAVAGYNDSEICHHVDPPLASVDPRDAQSSELAAWMLLDRIKNPGKPAMTELVPMPFICRASAG